MLETNTLSFKLMVCYVNFIATTFIKWFILASHFFLVESCGFIDNAWGLVNISDKMYWIIFFFFSMKIFSSSSSIIAFLYKDFGIKNLIPLNYPNLVPIQIFKHMGGANEPNNAKLDYKQAHIYKNQLIKYLLIIL